MATDERSNGSSFRRQVTFRIGPEDAPLLEAAARVHGGIQAGILAALRAYLAHRLQPVPPEPESQAEKTPFPPPPTHKEKPPPVSKKRPPRAALANERVLERSVELNVGEAAPLLGLSANTLRERIKRGTYPGRRGETGFYLAEISAETLRESGVEISPAGAAEVLGLRPGTIKARCKAGRYPNARNDGLGWSIPAVDIL